MVPKSMKIVTLHYLLYENAKDELLPDKTKSCMILFG